MQRDRMLDYWRGLLSFTRASHPATYELMRAAAQVGQFLAVHFKWQFQFPRPSQLSPALMPPIDPPGHASYPSGHATEAYLISEVLRDVLPAVASDGLTDALDRVAERVARNREVLGVHFRRDSLAGKALAEDTATINIFNACPTVAALTADAKDEWPS